MVVTPVFPKTQSEAIDQTEKILGSKLPEDYRKFLETYNGGFISPDKLEINSKQGKTTVDILYGLMDSSSNYDHLDLVKNYNNKKHQIPAGIVAIGNDPGGNYFCIALTDDKYGQVYFYDHEESNKDSQGNLTWDNLYLVANTFTSFLDKLH
jgi:cell wall assembly regulator SMI1